MADENAGFDQNAKNVVMGVTNDANLFRTQLRVDPTTLRLLVDASNSTAVTDGEAVDGTDTGVLILGTDGSNYQVIKVNSDGEIAVNLETSDIQIGAVEIKNSSDDTRATVGANGLYVDVQNLVAGTGATNLGKAEDAVHASADTGVMSLAVRKATPADLSDTDGDYEPLQIDNGRLWTSSTIDAALPAGTNAIGKLATNSGVDIGDVDILSIAAGDNNIGNVDLVSLPSGNLGQQLSAASLSVTPATDIADATYIGDIKFGESLPAGTATIGKLAANTGVDIGDVDILSIAAGDNNIGNVDIASAIPAGTNAIGKLAANSGVDIGDVDVTSITGVTMSNAGMQITGDEAHDAADAGNPVKIGGRAQSPTAAVDEVADNDRVDALFDRQGRLAVWNGYDVKSADINDAVSGDNTIVAAAGAGIRIAVIGCVIVSDGTTDVRWEDGAAGTAKTGQMPLQAREGFVMPIGIQPWFVGTANTLLNLELTAAVNVHGIVSYVEMTD